MARSYRHWTPGYIIDRLLLAAYEWRHPAAPWITRQACQFLGAWLQPHHVGIEWGSGRSTVWFAERVARLTSIEDDPAWFESVKGQLEMRGLTNVKYHLAPVDGERRQCYIELGGGAEESIDFALIDGQLREQCTAVAMKRLRPGGLLVIDNIERYVPSQSRSPAALRRRKARPTQAWMELASQLSMWNCVWTSDGVCDTAIFAKSAALAIKRRRSA